jgi:hypothetical protein
LTRRNGVALEDRIDRAENALKPADPDREVVTINVREIDSVIDEETGEKREIDLSGPEENFVCVHESVDARGNLLRVMTNAVH